MITTATLLLILVVIIKLVTNYRLWLNQKPVNHSKEWLIMALACVPSIILFVLSSQLELWFSIPLSALMCAMFIWLFFDAVYNMLRGYGIFFTGSDDKDDAKSDNFLQSIPLWLHILIKVGGLAGLITLYIIFL